VADEEAGRDPKSSSRDPALLKAAKYTAIGLEFPTTVAAGLFLGYYLDQYFGTKPWLVLVVGLAGVVAAFYRMVLLLRHLSRDSK